MNEEKYRKNIEKMTNADFVSFVNRKLQQRDILEKMLKEIDILEKILEENKLRGEKYE